jgi:hypothetical protein
MATASQSQPLQVTPPPTYFDSVSTKFVITHPASPMPTYSDQGYFAPLSSPPLSANPLALPAFPQNPPQTHFGPTPISNSQQQGLLNIPLPYYDPRSPYAIEQAISRARWRFIGGLLYAVGIFAVVGMFVGAESWGRH